MANHFIDLTHDEEIIELASYVGPLDPAVAGFKETCESNLKDGKVLECLLSIIGRVGAVCSGKAKDEDVEQTFNSIIHLWTAIEGEARTKLVKALAAALSAETLKGHDTSRLKVLINLFNSLDIEDGTRFDVYLAVVNVARVAGIVEKVWTGVEKMEVWLQQWKCTPLQARQLYKTIFANLKAGSEGSTNALIKLLQTYNGSKDLKDSAEDARHLVANVLVDLDTFDIDQVLNVDAIKALKGEPTYELLVVMSEADLDKLKGWYSSHRDAATKIGLSEDDLFRKVRLVRLATLLSKQNEVPLADISKHLQVESDEAESWVIEATRAGLIEAKIDEAHDRVIVQWSKQASFSDKDWPTLLANLKAWQANIGEVQKVLGTVKVQMQNQISASSSSYQSSSYQRRSGRSGR